MFYRKQNKFSFDESFITFTLFNGKKLLHISNMTNK